MLTFSPPVKFVRFLSHAPVAVEISYVGIAGAELSIHQRVLYPAVVLVPQFRVFPKETCHTPIIQDLFPWKPVERSRPTNAGIHTRTMIVEKWFVVSYGLAFPVSSHGLDYSRGWKSIYIRNRFRSEYKLTRVVFMQSAPGPRLY